MSNDYESANIEAIQSLFKLSSGLIEVVAQTNQNKIQTWIKSSVLSHVENTSFADINTQENIKSSISRISKSVREQIEIEKPDGFNIFTKNTINKDVEEFTKIAIAGKVKYFGKQSEKIFLEELKRNNDTLMKSFIDGHISFENTMQGIIENIAIADENKFLKNKEKYGQKEIARLVSIAISRTADPLAKAEYLDLAYDYLSADDYAKHLKDYEKSIEDDKKNNAQNSFFFQAINKIAQGKYNELSDREKSLPTIQIAQDKIQRIQSLSINSLKELQNIQRQKTINDYLQLIKNQGKKKPEQIEKIETQLSQLSLGEIRSYISANVTKKDISGQTILKSLEDTSFENQLLEQRIKYLESQFSTDSATTAVELGFREDVFIDFSSPDSIEDGISQLNLNFQDDSQTNYATTYMSTYLLDDFSTGYDQQTEKNKFALIKRFSDRMPDQAKKSFINQLALINKPASVNFELYSLTKKNYTQEINKVYEDGIKPSDATTDTVEKAILAGYGNSPISQNIAEIYRNLPKNSPLKEKIKQSINISDGMYFAEPIQIQINNIGNQNNFSKTITLAQGIQKMNKNLLVNISGAKNIYRFVDFQTREAINDVDINFIELQNLGGGSFVLFSGSNQSIDNALVDENGNILVFDINTLKENIIFNERQLFLQQESYRRY